MREGVRGEARDVGDLLSLSWFCVCVLMCLCVLCVNVVFWLSVGFVW